MHGFSPISSRPLIFHWTNLEIILLKKNTWKHNGFRDFRLFCCISKLISWKRTGFRLFSYQLIWFDGKNVIFLTGSPKWRPEVAIAPWWSPWSCGVPTPPPTAFPPFTWCVTRRHLSPVLLTAKSSSGRWTRRPKRTPNGTWHLDICSWVILRLLSV